MMGTLFDDIDDAIKAALERQRMSDERHPDGTPKTPIGKCRKCGHKIDSASHMMSDAAPKEGDVSLCLKCGTLHVFNADRSVRGPTLNEWDELFADYELMLELLRLELARKQVKAMEKPPKA